MKKFMRKSISILLVVALVMSMSFSVFAGTGVTISTEGGQLSVIPINENTCLISDETGIATINSKVTSTEEIISLNGTERDGYLSIDRNTGTLYSSFTGNTVRIEDLIEKETIRPMDAGKTTVYEYKISYKRLGEVITASATKKELAVAIVGIIGAVQGVTLAASTIMLTIGTTLFKDIMAGVAKKKPGGIVVQVNLTKTTRHQGGNIVPAYRYTVSVSQYK